MLKTQEAAKEKEFQSVPAGPAGAVEVSLSLSLLAQILRMIKLQRSLQQSFVRWAVCRLWSLVVGPLCKTFHRWSICVCNGCFPVADSTVNYKKTIYSHWHSIILAKWKWRKCVNLLNASVERANRANEFEMVLRNSNNDLVYWVLMHLYKNVFFSGR